jgi:hypothetical protein
MRAVSNVVAAFLLAVTIMVSVTAIYLVMFQFSSTMNVASDQLARVSYQSHEKIYVDQLKMSIVKTQDQYNITVTCVVYNVGSSDLTITNVILTMIYTSNVVNYLQTSTTEIPVGGFVPIRIVVTTNNNPTPATILLIILTQKGTTFVYKLQ